MERKRYLIKAHGDDLDATRQGVAKLITELKALGGDGVIVVPALQHAEHSMLATVLGDKLAKELIDKRVIDFDSSKIHLCSDRTLKKYSNAAVYLALWSTPYLIEEIEELHTWKSLIWVTWLIEESEDWVRKYQPTII